MIFSSRQNLPLRVHSPLGVLSSLSFHLLPHFPHHFEMQPTYRSFLLSVHRLPHSPQCFDIQLPSQSILPFSPVIPPLPPSFPHTAHSTPFPILAFPFSRFPGGFSGQLRFYSLSSQIIFFDPWTLWLVSSNSIL